MSEHDHIIYDWLIAEAAIVICLIKDIIGYLNQVNPIEKNYKLNAKQRQDTYFPEDRPTEHPASWEKCSK